MHLSGPPPAFHACFSAFPAVNSPIGAAGKNFMVCFVELPTFGMISFQRRLCRNGLILLIKGGKHPGFQTPRSFSGGLVRNKYFSCGEWPGRCYYWMKAETPGRPKTARRHAGWMLRAMPGTNRRGAAWPSLAGSWPGPAWPRPTGPGSAGARTRSSPGRRPRPRCAIQRPAGSRTGFAGW